MDTEATLNVPLGPDWTIICDFDGTITPFDVTDAVLTRFADKRWESIEEKWRQGKISARRCMEEQITLIDASRNELDAFLDEVPISEGYKEFLDFCALHALRLVVVSDGMDYAIKRVLSRHGLGGLPLIANRLTRTGERSYKLTFPYGAQGCPSGVCKCSVARASSDQVLLIGDGLSDCCAAGVASLTLARANKELEAVCKRNNYPHIVYNDFFAVRAIVAGLLERPCATKRPESPLARSA